MTPTPFVWALNTYLWVSNSIALNTDLAYLLLTELNILPVITLLVVLSFLGILYYRID